MITGTLPPRKQLLRGMAGSEMSSCPVEFLGAWDCPSDNGYAAHPAVVFRVLQLVSSGGRKRVKEEGKKEEN